MTLLLITLVTLAVIAIFLTRRTKRLAKPEDSIYSGYGIPMTEQEIELECQSNNQVLELLERNIAASGFFRAEKIRELIATLKEGSIPFGRTNTRVAFDGGPLLTVEEKKALGLNTRMKYSKKFIDYFEPSAFRTIEPKATLECMHLDAFHRVSRQKELLRFKKLGFVKEVEIVPCGDSRDCRKIKRLKKVYRLEEVPELPLPGCNAPYCRCMYVPIISKHA
jgi:hypothetical protein